MSYWIPDGLLTCKDAADYSFLLKSRASAVDLIHKMSGCVSWAVPSKLPPSPKLSLWRLTRPVFFGKTSRKVAFLCVAISTLTTCLRLTLHWLRSQADDYYLSGLIFRLSSIVEFCMTTLVFVYERSHNKKRIERE